MNLHQSSIVLRRWLLADAAISGAAGLMMLIGAGALDHLLGIPAALLRVAGIALLPFSGMVWYLSRQEAISRPIVLTVVALNAGWVAGSFLLLVSGWIAPTSVGVAFVILQALVVAAFAEFQYTALRRTALGVPA
jgi:hypothetical protein